MTKARFGNHPSFFYLYLNYISESVFQTFLAYFLLIMVQIIGYLPELQPQFEKINKEWVEKYFTLQPFDLEQSGNPQEIILNHY